MNTLCKFTAAAVLGISITLTGAAARAGAKAPADIVKMKPYVATRAKKQDKDELAARAAYAKVQEMKNFAYVPVTGWMADPAASVKSMRPDADNSGLEKADLPYNCQKMGPCIFRTDFTVPEKAYGFKIGESEMTLEFSGMGIMDIFVNGKRVSGFTGNGVVDITGKLKPGDNVTLGVKLTEMTQHGKLESVKLHVKSLDALAAPADEVMSLLGNAALMFEQLPNKQKPLQAAVAAAARELDAMKGNTDPARAVAGLEKIKKLLAPVSELLAKYPLFNAGPALQNVKPDGITVTWETRVPAPSAVYYGTGGLTNVVSDPAPATFHKIVIKGLKPQTEYKYLAVSSKLAGPASMFRTTKKSGTPFGFTVFGDDQGNPGVLEPLADLMIGLKPDFIFSVGDETDCGIGYETWASQLFHPLRRLIINTPYFVAIGNHEYCGGSCGNPVEWFDKYMALPEAEGGYYYAMTYGNSRFIVLNMQEYAGCIGAVPSSKQYEWLLKEFESPEYKAATFRFVLMHEPPYSEYWGSAYKYDGESWEREHLVPLLEKYKVDIMFSGHVHEYERGQWPRPGGTYYVITGGGGGGLDDIFVRDWPQIEKTKSVHHFVSVKVDGKKLTLKAIGLDGKAFDSFEINK